MQTTPAQKGFFCNIFKEKKSFLKCGFRVFRYDFPPKNSKAAFYLSYNENK